MGNKDPIEFLTDTIPDGLSLFSTSNVFWDSHDKFSGMVLHDRHCTQHTIFG